MAAQDGNHVGQESTEKGGRGMAGCGFSRCRVWKVEYQADGVMIRSPYHLPGIAIALMASPGERPSRRANLVWPRVRQARGNRRRRDRCRQTIGDTLRATIGRSQPISASNRIAWRANVRTLRIKHASNAKRLKGNDLKSPDRHFFPYVSERAVMRANRFSSKISTPRNQRPR